MNLFDIIMIAIMGFAIVRGILKGIISELFSIAGILLSSCLAYHLYDTLSSNFTSWPYDKTYADLISFSIIFIIVIFITSFIALFIKYLMNLNQSGYINRTCGGFFGLLKGILILSILITMLINFLPQNNTFIKNSHLSSYLVQILKTTINFTDPNLNLSSLSKK